MDVFVDYFSVVRPDDYEAVSGAFCGAGFNARGGKDDRGVDQSNVGVFVFAEKDAAVGHQVFYSFGLRGQIAEPIANQNLFDQVRRRLSRLIYPVNSLAYRVEIKDSRRGKKNIRAGRLRRVRWVCRIRYCRRGERRKNIDAKAANHSYRRTSAIRAYQLRRVNRGRPGQIVNSRRRAIAASGP